MICMPEEVNPVTHEAPINALRMVIHVIGSFGA